MKSKDQQRDGFWPQLITVKGNNFLFLSSRQERTESKLQGNVSEKNFVLFVDWFVVTLIGS